MRKAVGLLLAVLFCATLSTPAISERPRKPIWEWTVEERLTARFAPGAREGRVNEWASRGADSGIGVNAASAPAKPVDSLRGAEHPELLLPTEVFGSFIRAAYGHDDEVALIFRRDASQKAAAYALPAHVPELIAQRSAEYISLERAARLIRERLERGAGSDAAALRAELRRINSAACAKRVEALNALRNEFATFDRFLYGAIAPAVFYTVYEPQDSEMLRAQERGSIARCARPGPCLPD